MDEKECFKCKIVKPLSDFYKHPAMADGHLNKCKECNKNDTQKNYRKNHEYYREYDKARYQTPKRKELGKRSLKEHRKKYPEHNKARAALNRAIRSGKIQKQPCSECGSDQNINAHHKDYSKPLDVIWLCSQCHGKQHRKYE